MRGLTQYLQCAPIRMKCTLSVELDPLSQIVFILCACALFGTIYYN